MSDPQPKPPTFATVAANAAARRTLPFDDAQDFADARRGFIAALPEPVLIANAAGRPVWSLAPYDFLGTSEGDDAPDSVHPSLWRCAKLNMIHGLFAVTDGIWQVRGYDLSVMTIIRGASGWVVIDPFISAEIAATVWRDLVVPQLGDRPIRAVIYTHSHVDHYGGVRGLVDQAQVDAGAVRIVAPDGFVEAAVGENVLAGAAMRRRAMYMYGALLPRGPLGQVDAGLGKTTSAGTIGMILPTELVRETGERLTLDGVELVAIMAPDSEAPAEFMFHLPAFKAFCAAENASHTMHNLYTLRGAKVRDGLLWSKYLQQALDMFGADMEILFASHHWPTWSNARTVAMLGAQRDLYRHLHDQTMRLANTGLTPFEIGETLRLPESLERLWHARGLYGSVHHNARAQYDLRLGFFDGVPANLHRLPPVESARRTVEFMGGAEALLARARASYEATEYRWVAEVVNHLVFAEPGNVAAKQLLADAYEQLGYQSEASSWRNFYLTGAQELRHGVRRPSRPAAASSDTVRAMPLEMFFDYLGVRLNGGRAAGHSVAIDITLTDTGEAYRLGVENATLHVSRNRDTGRPDAEIRTTRAALNDVMVGGTGLEAAIVDGRVEVEGDAARLAAFLSWLDPEDVWFDIVTP